ncbi:MULTISPECIES: helix-turn-helix domain-containing protein [Chitinophaga]|uniref:helix-turn-helix domain-containing protein n=1 Tax=Chitinophaga TaxID=79328 RepID=UPI000BAFC6A7|nr:hypothetical protein CK934_27900 [Chitinophaga sp. MD30]
MDDKKLLQQIGFTLKQIRERKGYTVRTLEAYSSMDNGHISRIENGQKRLSVTTLVKICEALEVLPSDVLKEAGL